MPNAQTETSTDLGKAWPLRFNSYSFGAICYNTLASRVIFCNALQTSRKELDSPSGQPHRPDWKEHWHADFTHDSGPPDSFPTPIDIKWTALDGVERETSIDLNDVFPDRLILHDAKPEDLEPWWAEIGFMGRGHHVEILLEVNDRTINIYMKTEVRTKHQEKAPDGSDRHVLLQKMALVWTKTF
jgi:hypothetical protein